MLVSDRSTLAISLLFVFLVVSVVGIEQVSYLADFVLEVNSINFGVMQLRIWAAVSVNENKKLLLDSPRNLSRSFCILKEIVYHKVFVKFGQAVLEDC